LWLGPVEPLYGKVLHSANVLMHPMTPEPRSPSTLAGHVVQYLQANRFACEYQPVVCTQTEAVCGYEAVSRFCLDGRLVAPDAVFNSLQGDRALFFALESRMKIFQLIHRPARGKLFLNLDPLMCQEAEQVAFWLRLLQTNPGIVVEVIERTNASHVAGVQIFMKEMKNAGIDVALDDIGGPRSMLSFDLLDSCTFMKLDRRWFELLRRETAYFELLKGLLSFAKARNISTVLEGIETPHDFDLARDLNVDFVQGFLFESEFQRVDAEGGLTRV
jgi:EAL domain-containing protein (putative c-di-GMP-specific phosphodiesterase class I)